MTARSGKKLSVRKAPTQARSQQMVRGILEATKRLLKRSTSDSSARLTTNHIAHEAGISVGSLYQYFPNVEAILLALHQSNMDRVQAVLDAWNTPAHLALPRWEFLERLNAAILHAEAESEVVFALHRAMKTDPALAAADRRHAEAVAQKLGAFLKHHGSTWAPRKLQRLVLYVYYVNFGTWLYRDHVRPGKKESQDWEVATIRSLYERCFE
ncbi:MAG: TetR/AcrR family transcriptional regulator [Gammaproteobacteria bacterium]|nr:TetR/AcrR family transcriptional regulator [Gammaproteobacteria bacterium]